MRLKKHFFKSFLCTSPETQSRTTASYCFYIDLSFLLPLRTNLPPTTGKLFFQSKDFQHSGIFKTKRKKHFLPTKNCRFFNLQKIWFQSVNKTISCPAQTKIFLTNNRSYENFHTNVSYSFYKLPFVCLLFHVKHRVLHIFHFF